VGSYKVTLTVTDSNGATAVVGHGIQIEQPPSPTAVISGPTTGRVGQTVTFDGSGSSINGGKIVKYEWNFGDGTTGSGVKVTHTYAKAGSYKVSLKVTASDGATATAGHGIQIERPPSPTAVISGPTSGRVGERVTFDGSGSSVNGGKIVKYEWNFGDGATGSGVKVTHAYARAGSHKVTLTVTASDGAKATAGHTIQIKESSPAAPGPGSSTSPAPSRSATPPPTSGRSSSTNGTSGKGAPAAGSKSAPHTSKPSAKKSR
jgi:PKD repeat protein